MLELPKNIDYHFLIRFLRDEVSQEEREFIESWLSESEKNREIFSEIALLWDKIGHQKLPTPPDPFLQWEKISEKVHASKSFEQEEILLPIEGNLSQIKSRQFEKFYSIAQKRVLTSYIVRFAAMFLFALTSWVLLYGIKPSAEKVITENLEQSKMYEAIARKGEKITLTLGDGSKVYINSDSRLVYPNIFKPDSREVELTGEAYFAVTHNPEKPFRVKSGNTVTVVRGTEFNIRNRENAISVVVAKGIVDTYSPLRNKKYSLRKGDMVRYNDITGLSKPQQVDLKKYLAWREDKLAFDNTSLSEVVDEIERCFNVDVEFGDNSLRSKTITGIFQSDSLDRMLSIISLTLDLKIYHSGSKIKITGNK